MPEGSPQCQTTVIKAGCSIRFLQPFFAALSFPVLLVTALRSSCSFDYFKEMSSWTKFLFSHLLFIISFDLMLGEKLIWSKDHFIFSATSGNQSFFLSPALWINNDLNVFAIICLLMNLSISVSARTSAFRECRSEDPDDRVWGSIKYLLPLPFNQSNFLSLVWWYKVNTLNTPKSSFYAFLIQPCLIHSYQQLLITIRVFNYLIFMLFICFCNVER